MDKEIKTSKVKSDQEKKDTTKNVTVRIKPLKLGGGQKKSN